MASDASPDFRKALISSMIVELADIVSSQDGNMGELTYQNTLFPEPATKGEKPSVSDNEQMLGKTHVYRVSIEQNSVQMISILRTCGLE